MPRLIPPETKAEARRLRAAGASLNDIVARTGIAKSSASLLVRDIPLTDTQRAGLKDGALDKARLGHLAWSRRCRERRRLAQLIGRHLAAEHPSYATGVLLYWAEGSKSRNQVKIVNADAQLLWTWLRWLDEWYEIPETRKALTINCFLGNGLALDEIERWWLEKLGLPASCLRPSLVNRPSRASKKVHRPLLYGTAAVQVSSTFVVQSIYGAIQQIGGFERPEWLDLGGAMPEDAADADGARTGVGG